MDYHRTMKPKPSSDVTMMFYHTVITLLIPEPYQSRCPLRRSDRTLSSQVVWIAADTTTPATVANPTTFTSDFASLFTVVQQSRLGV